MLFSCAEKRFARRLSGLFYLEVNMSIQDQIAAKKSELADLEAQLAQAMPHLSVLAEIESFADRIEQSARMDFAALIAKARGLF